MSGLFLEQHDGVVGDYLLEALMENEATRIGTTELPWESNIM